MKKQIIFFLILMTGIAFLNMKSSAQPNIPDGSVAPTAVADPLPPDYNPNALGGKRNYVRKYDLKYPETDASLIQSNVSILNAIMSTDYFDGLGRPLQSVVKRGISGFKDFVQTKTYDDFGRETYQYLPYGAPITDGKFKLYAFTDLDIFYNTEPFPGCGNYSSEEIRYSKTEFDNSPLNRPVKQYKAGNAWGGNNTGVEILTGSNGNNIRKWDVSGNLPVTSTVYTDNELYSSGTVDEDYHRNITYTDKNGKVVAKTVFEKIVCINPVACSHKYLYTYYVYDELERLRFVIPPLAVQQLQNVMNWQVNQDLLNELCFQYKYDEKGQIIEKKIPGKDWEYLIYDKKGRVVFTQDGNFRPGNKWNFMVYDQLDRTKVSGVYVNNMARQAFQDYITTAFGPLNTINELLYWITDYEIGNYEYPVLNDAEIQTYDYYDRYPAWVANTFDASQGANFPGGMLHTDLSPLGALINGNVTATKIKIIKPVGSPLADWITSVNYYDKKGRLIQSQQTNSVNGNDVTSVMYDYSNNILATYSTHTNPTVNTPLAISPMYNTTAILKKYIYDHQQRLTSVTCKINNSAEMSLSSNMYDALGRLRRKAMGGSVETQTYSYNINGWLTGINPDWVNTPVPNFVNYFGETLSYENGFAAPNYNGNIAGVKWRGADVTKGQRAYGYSYDKLDRLTHAEFRENEIVAGAWNNNWNKTALDFTVSNLEYDANGNILAMDQRGPGPTGPVDMDVMDYVYKTIGGVPTNKLGKVTDNLPAGPYTNGTNHDFKDGGNAGDDYDYDVNGNLILDGNKKIASITYSQQNQPQLITLSNGNSIEYIYDAEGNKLQKTVNDMVASTTTITDYVNGHIYNTKIANGSTATNLEYILHEEGQIRPFVDAQLQDTYTYDFFVKDHLGNVRATLNAVEVNGTPAAAIAYNATMEPALLPQETILFDDMDNVISSKPASTDPANTQAIVLDGDDETRRIGTSLLLRVTPGDKFAIKTQAYYNTATINEPIDPGELIQNLINVLNANDEGNYLGDLPASEVIQNTIGSSTFVNAWSAFKSAQADNGKPLAYINYVFFDDNFNFIATKSGSLQVNTPNVWHELWTGAAPIEVQRPGYLYVFHSIENLNKVYFDDFDLSYYKGSLRDESHYYPFGLTMGMPMSYGATGVNQKYKYTTKELQRDEFGANGGLEWYDFGSRMQDPQIGRWSVLDPLQAKYPSLSPYCFVGNYVTMANDPDGERIFFVNGHWNSTFIGGWIGATEPGKNYWGIGFANAAQKFIGDYSPIYHKNYIDGSTLFGGDMSGQDRFEAGKKYAKTHLRELTSGLKKNEAINFVSHSEGAAFAAGMATFLIGENYPVATMIHLSPDEGDEFSTPSSPRTYELSYEGDPVTSNEPISGGVDLLGVVNSGLPWYYVHGTTRGARVFDQLTDLETMTYSYTNNGIRQDMQSTPNNTKFTYIEREVMKGGFLNMKCTFFGDDNGQRSYSIHKW